MTTATDGGDGDSDLVICACGWQFSLTRGSATLTCPCGLPIPGRLSDPPVLGVCRDGAGAWYMLIQVGPIVSEGLKVPEEVALALRRYLAAAGPTPLATVVALVAEKFRCDRCGWPIDPRGQRCRPGDCSQRPLPPRGNP